MTEITKMQVDTIIAMMRNAGFDVTRQDFEAAGGKCLAFTCPPRSRLMFGAVISRVVQVPNLLAHEMILAGCTEHVRGQVGTTLYFPGFTEAG